MKKPKLDGDGAFHEKAKKNTKVNLGGPSKTKKKTTEVIRELEKTLKKIKEFKPEKKDACV